MRQSRESIARERLEHIVFPDISEPNIHRLVDKISKGASLSSEDSASLVCLLKSLLPRKRGRPSLGSKKYSMVCIKMDIDCLMEGMGLSQKEAFAYYAQDSAIQVATVKRYYDEGRRLVDCEEDDPIVKSIVQRAGRYDWLRGAEDRRSRRRQKSD